MGNTQYGERGRVMHDHNFKATDIPGVCLCKCGVERYYARELQTYITVEEGEKLSGGIVMNKIATCLNCSERLTTMNADAHNCEGEE